MKAQSSEVQTTLCRLERVLSHSLRGAFFLSWPMVLSKMLSMAATVMVMVGPRVGEISALDMTVRNARENS